MAFCTQCGAQLSEGANFCKYCGATVAAAPMQQDAPMQPQPVASPAPAFGSHGQGFVRFRSLTEAVELAIGRNAEGEWRNWDSNWLDTSVRKIRRFAEKEDRRLADVDDGEGILYYVTSPMGSVGQTYEDDMDDDKPVLEWLFYAPHESAESLPTTVWELPA